MARAALHSPTAIRSVALLEFGKGLLVLLTALAVFRYWHTDWQALAERIVNHFHLNPAHHFPRVLFALAHNLTSPHLAALAVGALCYVGLRWAEAWGLWFNRPWAAWLGIVSAGLYLPFELIDLVSRPGWITAGLMAINLFIIRILWRNRPAR